MIEIRSHVWSCTRLQKNIQIGRRYSEILLYIWAYVTMYCNGFHGNYFVLVGFLYILIYSVLRITCKSLGIILAIYSVVTLNLTGLLMC